MALYRETATGFIQEWVSNPGAGYVAVSAMPTDTIAHRVEWYRNLDTYNQVSSWHPSVYRGPEDAGEQLLTIQFSKDSALIASDSSGAVSDGYLGASTEARVFRGQSDVTITEGWTLTKVDNLCTSTLTLVGGVWTAAITSIPLLVTRSGYVRITATRTGNTPLVRDFQFLKVPSGAAGPDGGVGPTGPGGTRGSRQILVAGTSWSNLAAWNGVVAQTGTNPVLSDMVTIADAPSAFSVSKFYAGGVSPGSWTTVTQYINGNLLITGTVAGNALVAGSVTADRIDARGLSIKNAAGTVTFSANDPITATTASTFIADAAITNAKIANLSADKLTAGTINASNITVTNLNATNITTGTLNGGLVGASTIGTTALANSAVSTVKLADGSITTAKVGNQQITWAQIALATIGAAQIGDASITNAKIASLSADKLTAGTINASVIGVTNLNASNINTGILNAAVVAVTNIDASNVVTGTLNAGVVNVSNINASNINGGTLNCGWLTVTNLSASSITTGTLNAGAVTVTNLNASNINTGTINGGLIGAGSVGNTAIGGGAVTIEKVSAGACTNAIAGNVTLQYANGGSANYSQPVPATPGNAVRGKVVCIVGIYFYNVVSAGAQFQINATLSNGGSSASSSGTASSGYGTTAILERQNIVLVSTDLNPSAYAYNVSLNLNFTGEGYYKIDYAVMELRR